MQPFGENTLNIPAFLGKLWKMVNDPNTDHLICWSTAGNSFIIQNQAQFWYELLPLYYKHNNMSSFVRQLNMYGFHKMSTIENGSLDTDKDEIQFYHKYFQKDQPSLLKNIKRKVTTAKVSENKMQNVMRNDDISKVLTDVKQLRGRQSSVDSQLTAMKQENAVLWRELALLRQKHIKQQQIVNKLIQFLVTLVQPNANNRMGVGVKRRMPLMLHESPSKRPAPKKTVGTGEVSDNGGPIIHELDNEIEVATEELLDPEIEDVLVTSPQAPADSPAASTSTHPPSVSSIDANTDDLLLDDLWDKPEFVEITSLQSQAALNNEELVDENISNLQTTNDGKEVFLNSTGRDTLLSNIVNGSYNTSSVSNKNGKKISKSVTEPVTNSTNAKRDDNNCDMTVATRDFKINNGDDLDFHLSTTQGEIEQLRDFLHGYNTFDANTLLGLFNDDHPEYGLTPSQSENNPTTVLDKDPMVSGTELAKNNTIIDFNELFDNSLDGQDNFESLSQDGINSVMNTPSIIKPEPNFDKYI